MILMIPKNKHNLRSSLKCQVMLPSSKEHYLISKKLVSEFIEKISHNQQQKFKVNGKIQNKMTAKMTRFNMIHWQT